MRDLSRRRFLRGTAATAGLTMLAACSDTGGGQGGSGEGKADPRKRGGGRTPRGSTTKPLEPPSTFQEAPALKKRADAGAIPPVADRLPERPYVVPHRWLETGRYGGRLLMVGPASSTGAAEPRNFMYGLSPLRWLNDGRDVGTGLIESWESNDDASQWTLHFRKGLKWSDGHPWSTADILFWWEDLVLNKESPEVAPDECRSGKGTLAKLAAPDDMTLTMTFDAPAPLTADRLANWPNGQGGGGPIWMVPKHYVKQFHPRYNKNAPDDWASAGGVMEEHGNFMKNPRCPTMTGWRLKSYHEGSSLIWERNPYYWCVDREGNQLPYIDTLHIGVVQDVEVAKLQIRDGKVDYVQGNLMGLGLADVSSLKRAGKKADISVLLWDSGSGGGSDFYFNYDYPDEKLRALIRKPEFRQALSHGFDRDVAQKVLYFNTGEKTTGTMSPKAAEFHTAPNGQDIYKKWRDSYIEYAPEKAKKMLDKLGVVDRDGDGYRELPDGTKLVIRLEYAADANEIALKKNERLRHDWHKIGIATEQSPVPPPALGDLWSAGKMMTRTDWQAPGDGPNCLVYPHWLVPIGPNRWAPLEGQYYAVRGTSKEGTEPDVDPFKRTPPRMAPEKGGPIERLWEIYDKTKTEPDELRRTKMVWEMIKIHITDGPFFQGTVANYPHIIVARNGLGNVPQRENLAQHGFVDPSVHPTPAVYDPETYFWDEPDRHA